MTQYDAGPGDWSDREWESPDKRPKPHARRRRVTLPGWALLTILVGVVILLCVSLVVIVRAIRGGDRETPTPRPTLTLAATPSRTPVPVTPTNTVTPTATVELPIGGSEEPSPVPSEIGPGATVVVHGTLGAGLNLRAEPSTTARVIGNAKEGAVLTVVEGPQDAGGYTWWKVRMSDGKEGWGAANWLVLKTE